MKTLFFILSAMALVSFGCRSNTNAQNDSQPALEAVEQIQEPAPEPGADLPRIVKPAAYQAWLAIAKSLGLKGEYVCPENSALSYTVELVDEEGAEGYMIDDQVFCYPYKEEGFFTVHSHVEAAEGQGGEFEYTFYFFDDDVLNKIESPLPVPDFADLLSDSKDAPLQEDMVEKLKNLFNSRPGDFVAYEFHPEEFIVKAYLHPLSWSRDVEPDEKGHCNWLEQFYEMRAEPDKNTYKWDGEKFIKAE